MESVYIVDYDLPKNQPGRRQFYRFLHKILDSTKWKKAVIVLLWWMIILKHYQFWNWLRHLIQSMHMYTRQFYWSNTKI
jgi:hypothetical protein